MKGSYPRTERQRREASARFKARWTDPDYRARQAAAASARMKRLRCDVKFLALLDAGQRRARHHQTPEARERTSKIMRAYYADPENRRRGAERQRRRMQDPEVRARAVAGGLKGVVARCGVFYCPSHHRRLYRKLSEVLGRARARDEIRRIAQDEAFRPKAAA